ncbi:MAG: hypothetical protein COB76_07110 [Alphaproteobacteria bacterium]|nr:MAG: hypothetical protein COB76_07110 [Alphaproteobacteria bacterium]
MGIVDLSPLGIVSGTLEETTRQHLQAQLESDAKYFPSEFLKKVYKENPEFVEWMLDNDPVTLDVYMPGKKNSLEKHCNEQLKIYRAEKSNKLSTEFSNLNKKRDGFLVRLKAFKPKIF